MTAARKFRAAVTHSSQGSWVSGKRYSLFCGRVVEREAEFSGRSPHYHLLLQGAGDLFRVAVNTQSGTSHHRDTDLLFLADDDFRHPMTMRLADVADGYLPVESRPHGLALDYQRGGMFDRRHMRRIPSNRPGPNNDLIEELDHRVERALADPSTRLFAYGTRWGPEPQLPDQIFGFTPGNGIHDVHMNQGNRDEHWHDNRIWADGGLLFHEPQHDRWCAIFLAFQAQSWHTDSHGNPIPYPNGHEQGQQRSREPRQPARIVTAFVHPNDEKTGIEHVGVRNDSGALLDFTGWRLENRSGDSLTLEGVIPPRRVRRFDLPERVPLSTRGGVIRLLDRSGQEIDSVRYTRGETRRKRGSLNF